MAAETWTEWRQPSPGRAPLAEIEPGDRGLDDRSLLRYVLTARVDLLAERIYDPQQRRWVPACPPAATYGRGALAGKLGYSSSQLSRLIGPGAELNRNQVMQLEHRLLTFAYVHRGATQEAVRALGSLTAFWQELRGPGRRDESDDRRVNLSSASWNLALWFDELCSVPPQNAASALVLGEAFVALLAAAETPSAVEAAWQAHATQADLTMRALVAVAMEPPGPAPVDAIQLAALVGRRVLPIVARQIETSAVGFRATRILTRMLFLAQGACPAWWDSDGDAEVADAWKILESLEARLALLPDPYPARSFSVEALRVAARDPRIPKDNVVRALRHRYENADRPIRERLYAAYCLEEVDPDHALELRASVAAKVREDRAWAHLATLLDVKQAGSLEALLLAGRTFADAQVPEGDLIHRHARTAGIGDDGTLSHLARLPASVRRGTRQLIRYALLSPDGSTRRRACEALREAGVTKEAAGVVAEVLLDEGSPRWLQEISAFVASYLNESWVAPVLERVAADNARPVSVRHAAFFALGDLGAPRRRTVELAMSVAREAGATPVEVVRAATYALAAVQAGDDGEVLREAQLDVLARLCHVAMQPDDITRRLADWGLDRAARQRARERYSSQSQISGLDGGGGSPSA